MSEDDITDVEKGVWGDLEWIKWWRTGEAPWHNENVDPYLENNGTTLFGGAKRRIFVPLCGKSLDLLWLYKQGHTVVGVEIAEQAVEELFQENNIDHVVEDLQDTGKIYKSRDEHLIVFAASIFSDSAARFGKFDVIWDNQSFTAINLDDHIRYRDLICAVMKPICVCYLKTLEYDDTLWPGPPHSTSDEVVKETFGKVLNIELLEETSPPGYGIEVNPKDNQSIDTGDSDREEQADNQSFETNSHKERKDDNIGEPSLTKQPNMPKELINPLPFVKKSRFILNRWYKLTLK